MAKRKPGKYDHILPRLKPLPPVDVPHQARVDAEKQRVRKCAACDGTGVQTTYVGDGIKACFHCDGTGRRKLTGNAIVRMYVDAREAKEALEETIKKASLTLEAVSQMLIDSQATGDADWGAYGASDRAIKMLNNDTLRVQPEIFAMVRDKQDFRTWCYTNGLSGKMELPEKPTNDLVKLRLLLGEPEPSGIEVYVRTRIVYTPAGTEVVADEQTTGTPTQDAEIF